MSNGEKDLIMKSINQNLRKPIISANVSIMPESDAMHTLSGENESNITTISNISNISSISNVSSINNSSLYTVRQEQRLDLYLYVKQMIWVYLSEIAYHMGLTTAVAIIGAIIGTTILYGWSLVISAFLVVIYGVMLSSNLTSIIRAWRHDRSDGIDRFWAACMVLAYKNALILQEYIDVYRYASKSNNRRTGNMTDSETFMIDDPEFQFVHPSEIKNILKRIHSYIRLAYELGTLTKADNLIIQRNVVYCNVSEQSLTNERNRRIEKLLNGLSSEKKADIVDSWNAIDKNLSAKNQSMSFIPFRWMIYEYRNLFRYMNSSPELRKIYNNVKLNFESYEQCVTDISIALHSMRIEESIYPSDMSRFTMRIGDMLGVSADSFFGLSIASSIISGSTIWSMISSGCLSLIVGGFMHLITIITIHEVQNLILQDRSKSLSESQIDLIMKEISIICC